jgi:hypothetical protein
VSIMKATQRAVKFYQTFLEWQTGRYICQVEILQDFRDLVSLQNVHIHKLTIFSSNKSTYPRKLNNESHTEG